MKEIPVISKYRLTQQVVVTNLYYFYMQWREDFDECSDHGFSKLTKSQVANLVGHEGQAALR